MLDYNQNLEHLTRHHPQITEKAIIDFLNASAVTADHLKEQKKCQDSALSRMWGSITGTTPKRQTLINENLNNDISFIRNYILDHESRLSHDQVLQSEIMEGVCLLSNKLKNLDSGFSIVQKELGILETEIRNIKNTTSKLIDGIILRQNATDEMNAALSEFKAGRDNLAPEQALWVMLNGLRYGYFGQYLNQEKNPSLLTILRNESVEILSNRSGRSENELMDRATTFSFLQSKEPATRDCLLILSNHASSNIENAIYHLNSDELDTTPENTPYIYSNLSLTNEMLGLLEKRESHACR